MPDFLDLFSARAGEAGAMDFARFMALALYDPELGYYRRDRARVGRDAGADFYTATSLGPLFGELAAAAAASLLGGEAAAREHVFVEIGAEPGGGVLAGAHHPFAETRILRVGDPREIPPRAVVFSNELFDAQPFHRLVFRDGAWRELGVNRAGDALREIELPALSAEVAAAAARLPAAPGEGYRLDLPLAAEALAERIAAAPWRGLFLAFDYGKSWAALAAETPQGTARAYRRHAQGNDLLAHPGGQDLTCHVCWDWLVDALARHGFSAPALESQEAFFIKHAGDALAALVQSEAGRMNPRKLAALHLLHPGQMGQKFQALWACRG